MKPFTPLLVASMQRVSSTTHMYTNLQYISFPHVSEYLMMIARRNDWRLGDLCRVALDYCALFILEETDLDWLLGAASKQGSSAACCLGRS